MVGAMWGVADDDHRRLLRAAGRQQFQPGRPDGVLRPDRDHRFDTHEWQPTRAPPDRQPRSTVNPSGPAVCDSCLARQSSTAKPSASHQAFASAAVRKTCGIRMT